MMKGVKLQNAMRAQPEALTVAETFSPPYGNAISNKSNQSSRNGGREVKVARGKGGRASGSKSKGFSSFIVVPKPLVRERFEVAYVHNDT